MRRAYRGWVVFLSAAFVATCSPDGAREMQDASAGAQGGSAGSASNQAKDAAAADRAASIGGAGAASGGVGGVGGTAGQGGTGGRPNVPDANAGVGDASADGRGSAPDRPGGADAFDAPTAVACTTNPMKIYDDIAYLASPELRGRKPGDVGNRLSVEYAEKAFEAAGLLPAGTAGTYRQTFNAKGVMADNVLGKIVGVDARLGKEVIVVGAHIDHLGVNRDGTINYGADDNASGSAIVIELARMFDRCDVRPKRTILFAEFNAEEMGIIGSRFYVDNPTLPIADTIAMYNFDMVGSGDGTGVLLFGGNDPANRWMTDLMISAAKLDKLTHVIQVVPQKLASDHAPFVAKGIPITWGFSRPDPHPGYHLPGDNIGTIKLQTLKAVSELFWASLRRLAMGEEVR